MNEGKKATEAKQTENVVNTAALAEVEQEASPKKTNKTWEAFGKTKGCFIINDPKFLL